MKKFNLKDDVVFTFSSVGEHIRIVSSSVSRRSPGDPVLVGDNFNQVKTFVHWNEGPFSGGFFQSVFDRDHERPESIHLADFTYGVSVSSSLCGLESYLSSNCEFYPQKNRIYRLYAQQLLGQAGRVFQINGEDQYELIFINIRRHQYKDNISPGTVRLVSVYSGSINDVYEGRVFTDALSDAGVETTEGGIRGNLSPINRTTSLGGGDTTPGATLTGSELGKVIGHVYYQAGILVLVPDLFSHTPSQIGNYWFVSGTATGSYDSIARNNSGSNKTLEDTFTAIRQRFLQLDFRSNSRLRSTFYTTVAGREEYNYSSNPSFLDREGRIRTTSGSDGLQPRTFITKIGLLGQNNEVIAVGQLSRPVRKDPETEVEIVVRVDY